MVINKAGIPGGYREKKLKELLYMEGIVGILGVIMLILCLVGTIGYNGLRRKWAGIIGVGGSYVILLGIMLLVAVIGTLIKAITGQELGSGAGEIVGTVLIMLVCLGYMVLVIVGRCETTAQKVMLPLVACLIGAGFIWRLLLAIVAHVPMDSGESDTSASALDSMPDVIYDTNNGRAVYRKQGTYGDHVDYYGPNGQTVTFYESDVKGANYKGFALS